MPWSISTPTYDKDMKALGVVDIAPELLTEMQRGSKRKQQFDTKAMQQVAEHMRFCPLDGADFLQVGSGVSVLTETSHTTTGQDSICSVTLEGVSANLMSARQEFHRLVFALREMCPDHVIFEETNFARLLVSGRRISLLPSGDPVSPRHITYMNNVLATNKVAH
jgi:hypothetical protein